MINHLVTADQTPTFINILRSEVESMKTWKIKWAKTLHEGRFFFKKDFKLHVGESRHVIEVNLKFSAERAEGGARWENSLVGRPAFTITFSVGHPASRKVLRVVCWLSVSSWAWWRPVQKCYIIGVITVSTLWHKLERRLFSRQLIFNSKV